MREVVRQSRARTLVAKDLAGTGSAKEGSWLSMAEGETLQMNLLTRGLWLLGVGLALRGSELGPKGCSHVGKETSGRDHRQH